MFMHSLRKDNAIYCEWLVSTVAFCMAFCMAGLSREYESVQCFNGELAISLKSVKLQ